VTTSETTGRTEVAANANPDQSPSEITPTATALRFSLVVPMYDEQDNVADLLNEIDAALKGLEPFEVVFVDDRSKDATLERMLKWREDHKAEKWFRVLQLEQNTGQSGAVLAGALHSRGKFILTVDGDRQNDPADLPRILEILERGEADGVQGVRAKRKDTWMRRVSSRIGNGVRNWITGDRVTDSACGIKGFKREVFLSVQRFNGMHRFMTTLARYVGAKVVEIPVNHRPRVAGQAKYGVGNRALRGLKDCLAVRWMRGRSLRIHAVEKS
jgi:dolichol-phosphate mannosyltransferase